MISNDKKKCQMWVIWGRKHRLNINENNIKVKVMPIWRFFVLKQIYTFGNIQLN